MVILILCVLSQVSLAVCFKLFARLGIDTFTAIVINYWVSASLGSLILGYVPLVHHDPEVAPWTWYAVAIGCLFVIGFTTIGQSIRYVGMTITMAMQKMSLLIPTAYALIGYQEHAGPMKLTGIGLSIAAILLVTRPDKTDHRSLRKILPWLIFPFGALIFSGMIESILYHVQAEGLAIHGNIAFTAYGFSVAAFLGTIALIFRAVTSKYSISGKDILGGVLLGTPNFFSIYLILVLLKHDFPGSVLYPVLNILILILSAIIGLFLFRETLRKANLFGIVIAVLAIIFVSAREIILYLE